MRKDTKIIVIKVIACIFVLGLITVALMRERMPAETRIIGKIFGSTYLVITYGIPSISQTELAARIENRLNEINAALSLWDKTSEISRINNAPAHTPITISHDFSAVIKESMHLSEITDGVYDITVGPLVNLWGFGPDGKRASPSVSEIEEAKNKVGYRYLQYTDTTITKTKEGMLLDLSSKAPGYAVDEIGRLLEQFGYVNYLVEIGGEIAIKGVAPTGATWNIGIELPKDNENINSNLYGVISLRSGAVSTSGTYHRFSKTSAHKTHHIIDPNTGAPTDSAIVSVTVTAPTCIQADGLGTALLIMGEKKGLEWISKHPPFEVLFLTSNQQGFSHQMSPGFPKLSHTEKQT